MDALAVRMNEDEEALLAHHLVPGIRYLEFGGGGSTRLALARGVARCDTVESDPDWIGRLRHDHEISAAEVENRLRIHHGDIGPVGDWGMPRDTKKIEQWPAYFTSVWSDLPGAPDLVLIDGRFRVACALTALMLVPASSVILMHDFFDPAPWRRNYAKLLDFADIDGRAGDLVRLRLRPDVGPTAIVSALGRYWTDFA